MSTEVLIAGAGPTGVMLALQLARRGVRPLIIDRHSGAAQQSRAMGVQARTLEIYAKLGLAEAAIACGAITRGFNLWSNQRHKAKVPVARAGEGLSAFPFVLMLGQDENERILNDALAKFDVAVQWNTELLALDQQPDQVIATVRRPDGSVEKIHSRWLAGCDGSHSSVRGLCDIDFPGAPYEHVFFVADTTATGGMVQNELNAYLWRSGFHLFFPMRGDNRWRVIGILPPQLRERPKLTFAELVPELQREVGGGLQFQDCRWFSTYRIQHRCAERFRDRRCFLLGDAAHIHSPMGAQGMNTGLQDAYNLAWKLALVVAGQANESLLESFDLERRRVAQALLRGTDRAFGLVVSDTLLSAIFRTWIMANVMRVAMRFARVQRLAYRTVSQIGIRYRTSPLSKRVVPLLDGTPQPGDRFPWMLVTPLGEVRPVDLFQRMDDRRFNLLILGDQLAAPSPHAFVNVIVIPFDARNEASLRQAGLHRPCYFLVRPDGHIALAGTAAHMPEVTAYLDEHLRG
jgi:2-polyprenyl-6-methoxyphenol hydroxylase-like FAD-dependent oxidoreductase